MANIKSVKDGENSKTAINFTFLLMTWSSHDIHLDYVLAKSTG